MKKFMLIMLVLLIGFAVVLNFLPHLNYRLPLHVDEWVHFQYANHLSSESPLYFNQEYSSLEAGFHYLLATLNNIGIPYLFMFAFFASLTIALICLGVFILARQFFSEKTALFAVLFIALLQSTVAILGPMFFVPMAIGMFFITITLFLIKIKNPLWALVLASVLTIHPPTAMALLLLINIEFIILAIKKQQNYLKNLSFQIISGVLALPLYLDIFLIKKLETINSLSFTIISSPMFIPRFLGYLAIAIIILGIYYAAEKKKYSIAAYVCSLLVFIFVFYHYKIEVFIPYARALMYLFLIFALPFGYGCEKIINFTKNKNFRMIITVALIVLLLILLLPNKIESTKKVYHIINEQEYNDYIWIKENTDKNAIILADPWKANAITPIAERSVYSRIVQGPNSFYESRNNEINQFFQNNCTNLNLLKENNITVVYGKCEDLELEEVHPNVYLLPSQ